RVVRSLLHRMGYRFRIHVSSLPGRPDIVLPKWKRVIFVHGCFWHRHQRCKFAYTPKTRQDFWLGKFAGNVQRDKSNARRLRRLGWKVMTIWECETRRLERLKHRIKEAMASRNAGL